MRLLLEGGASVGATNGGGGSALLIACQDGHLECVRLLLEASAAINQANEDGVTPLFKACWQGHLEIVRLLLEAGAAKDQARDNGATPMGIACFKGHLGIVQLLSSYGASRAFPFDAPRDTAENLATHRGHHDTLAWLVRTRLWSTPLHHLEFLTPERALALLRADADIHAAAEPGGSEDR